MPRKKSFTTDNKRPLFSLVILICAAVLAIIFAVHLFTVNRNADTSNEEVRKSIREVAEFNFSSVEKVQKQVKDVMESDISPASLSSVKARYQKDFRNSVVIGDSLTEGLSLYGYLSEDEVFSVVGASLFTEDLFSQAAATLPEHAFFAFGMNDMGNFRGDPDSFIKKYKSVINRFLKDSPETKIYICTVTKPTQKAMKANRSISKYAEFNRAIKNMCAEENIPCIDVTPILIRKPEFYAGDGIHALPAYYPYWIEMMIREAGLE